MRAQTPRDAREEVGGRRARGERSREGVQGHVEAVRGERTWRGALVWRWESG